MNTTRTGKIARLPQYLRDEINQRLVDGQTGPDLIAWLNAMPRVQEILAQHFDGRPVTEQNLSEWRQGGHQDWLRLQETRSIAFSFIEAGHTLANDIDGPKFTDHLTSLFAVEFARVTQLMLREDLDLKQRWDCLCDIHRQLSRLRRDDCHVTKASIQRERWERQVTAETTAADEAFENETRRLRALRVQLASMIMGEGRKNGGGVRGRDAAASIYEQANGLPDGSLGRVDKKFPANEDVESSPPASTKSYPPEFRPASPEPVPLTPAPNLASAPEPTPPEPKPETLEPIALANDLPPTAPGNLPFSHLGPPRHPLPLHCIVSAPKPGHQRNKTPPSPSIYKQIAPFKKHPHPTRQPHPPTRS